jgi:hypothetical protein
MPMFLYQTIRMGKRARQWRHTESECVRDSVSLKVNDSVSHKNGQLAETFADGRV